MRYQRSRSFVRKAFPLLIALVGIMVLCIAAVRADPAAPEIVGGQEADPGEWPWQVVLVEKGKTPAVGFFCGGAILNKDWVLTAAHCVDSSAPDDLDIIAGIHDLSAPDAGFVRVGLSQVVVHQDWNFINKDNDIALLRLATPIPERVARANQLPIAYTTLATNAIGDLTGVTSTVTGWGNRNPNGNDYPPRLHEVEVPIISNADCLTPYPNVTDNMICAGFTQGGKDSCQGDSGGPLVVFKGNKWHQVGIVSFGKGCAEPDFPGVYARVTRYIDWIDTVINPVVPTDFAYLPVILSVPYISPVTPLENGDFEQGPDVGWTESSSNGYPLITGDFATTGVSAHSGSWAAWLGGLNDETSIISQQVTIQPGQTVLSYYYWIGSEDTCGYDFGGVFVNGTAVVVYDLCDDTSTGGWVRGTHDLAAYAGQSILLEFIVETDDSLNSNLFIDDVALGASLAADEPEPARQPAFNASAPKYQ